MAKILDVLKTKGQLLPMQFTLALRQDHTRKVKRIAFNVRPVTVK